MSRSATLENLRPQRIDNLEPLLAYPDELIDFEDLEEAMKIYIENLANLGDDLVNLDEIHVNDFLERGSANQSFYAQNSYQDFQLDQSFEKVLQNVKKQQKQ
jgi:hypothetical protein